MNLITQDMIAERKIKMESKQKIKIVLDWVDEYIDRERKAEMWSNAEDESQRRKKERDKKLYKTHKI